MRFEVRAKRETSGLAWRSRARIETDLDSGDYDQQGMLEFHVLKGQAMAKKLVKCLASMSLPCCD